MIRSSRTKKSVTSAAPQRRSSTLTLVAELLVAVAFAVALSQHGGLSVLAAASGGTAVFVLLWTLQRLISRPAQAPVAPLQQPAGALSANLFQRELDRLAAADDDDETEADAVVAQPPLRSQGAASAPAARSTAPDADQLRARQIAEAAAELRRAVEPQLPRPARSPVAPTAAQTAARPVPPPAPPVAKTQPPIAARPVMPPPVGDRAPAAHSFTPPMPTPMPPPVPAAQTPPAPMPAPAAQPVIEARPAHAHLSDALPWPNLSGRGDLVGDFNKTAAAAPEPTPAAPPPTPAPVLTARPLAFPDLPEVSAEATDAAQPVQPDSYVGAQIRKLADDLNAAAATPARAVLDPVLPTGRDTATAPADPLTASIDALRTASQQLQEPALQRTYPTLPLPDADRRWTEADFDALRKNEPQLPRGNEKEARSEPRPQASSAPAAPATTAEEVKDALLANRIEVWLAPVIGLLDRRMRHFDVDVRLRAKSGEMIKAAALAVKSAADAGLVDAARLARTADVATVLSERGKSGAILVRVSAASLRSSPFRATVENIGLSQPELAKRIVLTFTQAEVRGLDETGWQALAELRLSGVRFGIDDITEADIDFAMLRNAGFAFARIAAPVLLHGLSAGRARISPEDVCRHLASLDMTLISVAIDTEELRAGVFEIGVAFGQGLLLGAAKAMRPDVVAKASQTAAA